MLHFAIACAGGNMAENPGAEDVINRTAIKIPGVSFSEKLPAHGWTVKKSSGTCIWGVSEQEKHSGLYSIFCKVKSKNASGDFEFHILMENSQEKQGTAFRPDTVYYFSFWVKGSSFFTLNGRYLEETEDSTEAELKYMGIHSTSSAYPSSNWTKYEIAFTTSPKMRRLTPVIQICGNFGLREGDTVFIDDVEITPFEEKFPYSLNIKLIK